jgi:hypothetical protein
LRQDIGERLEELKRKGAQIANRLMLPALEDEKIKAFYYSSWLVSAIHVLVSIEGFRTTAAIARRLSISTEIANRILSQLRDFALIKEGKGEWSAGPTHLHLPRQSLFQIQHQTNWKLRALNDQSTNPESLHYCNVHSISALDFQRLREELLGFIASSNQVVQASPPEKLACLNLDYFEPI